MDHRYIDEHEIAERYLEPALPHDEHEAFEADAVDREECSDRSPLAQIFLERKATQATASPPTPKRAQFVARLAPWQLLLLAIVAAFLLLAVPTAYFLFEIGRLSGRR